MSNRPYDQPTAPSPSRPLPEVVEVTHEANVANVDVKEHDKFVTVKLVYGSLAVLGRSATKCATLTHGIQESVVSCSQTEFQVTGTVKNSEQLVAVTQHQETLARDQVSHGVGGNSLDDCLQSFTDGLIKTTPGYRMPDPCVLHWI